MSMKNWVGVLLLALVSSTAAYQGIRYTQIAAQDRQGNGNQFQMTRSNGTHSGCVQYDLSGNADGIGVPCGSGSGSVTHTGGLTAGQLIIGNGVSDITVGNLSGDATTSGSTVVTVVKANGTSIAASAAADQVLRTTAINVASWTAVPDCDDTAGQHLNYDTTAHTYSCGTSSATSGTVTSIATTSPITGGTITTTGTIACATCVTSAAALTSDLPVFGAGSQATAVGTRTGNTTKVVTSTGSLTNGNCLKSDANGNAVDSGLACSASTGGVGMVLIEQHTASTSSSLDFTSCISSSYDDYVLRLVSLLPASNSVNIIIRMSTDGGSTYDTSAIYDWVIFGVVTTGSGIASGNSDSNIQLANAVGNPTSWTVNGSVNLHDPGGSGFKFLEGHASDRSASANAVAIHLLSAVYRNTTAVNAFRILASSGNLTSGTVRCYGIAK